MGTIFMAVGRPGYVGAVMLEDESLNLAAALDSALLKNGLHLGTLAAEVFLAQGSILQHRAHAAIQHQNAVFQAIDEAGCLRGRCCYGHGRVCLQLDACQVDER